MEGSSVLVPDRGDAAFARAHSKLEKLVEASEGSPAVPSGESLAQQIVRRLRTRENLFRWFASISDGELELLLYDNEFWLRPEQMPPDIFEVCLMLAGRGFGKTHAGAAWVNKKAQEGKAFGALIAPTAADVRDTMVEGVSGVLALAPPWFRPIYEPSKTRLTWPNGVQAKCFSADKPDSLRGPNTGWTWGDEPATWKHEMAAYDQIAMFNRVGSESHPPSLLLTGTPKPIPKLAALARKKTTVLRTGNSFANRAFLAPSTLREMTALAATRFGRQEILGLLLMDTPGAIFAQAKWGRVFADPHTYSRKLERRIISVDPAPSSEEGSDEWGIIPMGSRTVKDLLHVSILGDLSGRMSPREGALTALKAYVAFNCEALVFEVNTGGEMGQVLLEAVAKEMGMEGQFNFQFVRAKEAKSKRAEPVAALAESRRIEFVGPAQKDDVNENAGQYPKLEKQLPTFTGINGRRDDRVDAMCWGVHHLVFSNHFWGIS